VPLARRVQPSTLKEKPMLTRPSVVLATGAVLAAGSLAFAPAAHADRLNFNLSLAGPGYGVSIGNAPYYAPYYRGHRHRHWRGAAAYVPPRVVYAPPRVVYPAPVVVSPPVTYYSSPYYYPGSVYYRY
jgi:hypothetical protein